MINSTINTRNLLSCVKLCVIIRVKPCVFIVQKNVHFFHYTHKPCKTLIAPHHFSHIFHSFFNSFYSLYHPRLFHFCTTPTTTATN